MKPFIARAAVSLALMFMGLLGGLLLGVVLPIPRDWEPLGSPPGQVVEVYILDETRVAVATHDQSAYTKVGDDAWEAVDVIPPHDENLVDGTFNDRTTPPPGEVVLSRETTLFTGDYRGDVRVVLLEDGSLWRWRDSGDFYIVLTRTLGLTVLCTVGASVMAIAGNIALLLAGRKHGTVPV